MSVEKKNTAAWTNKLLRITSTISNLDSPKRYVQVLESIWLDLEERAKRAKDESEADPENEALTAAFVNASERFLAFGETMSTGDKMVRNLVEITDRLLRTKEESVPNAIARFLDDAAHERQPMVYGKHRCVSEVVDVSDPKKVTN